MTSLRRRMIIPVAVAVLSVGGAVKAGHNAYRANEQLSSETESLGHNRAWAKQNILKADRLGAKCSTEECKAIIQKVQISAESMLHTNEALVKSTHDLFEVNALLAAILVICASLGTFRATEIFKENKELNPQKIR